MSYGSLAEALARGRGRERAFRCPVHSDAHASASVNVAKGLWVCYACHAHGTTEGVFEAEGVLFAGEIDELLADEGRTYSERWLDQYTSNPGPYWAERGFTPAAVEHFRLGMDWASLRPCYPMRAPDQSVLGVVYRAAAEDVHSPKYLYPRGVTKSELLFNYTEGYRKSVVLCEGALDAVACWDAGHEAFALYGATLHPRQLVLLFRTGASRIVLAMDNDKAGERAVYGWRTDYGEYIPGLEKKLTTAGFEVVAVNWAGIAGKDIAEVDRDTRNTLLDPLAL